MNINPYLNFDGTTEEAFTFYKSLFGGEFSALQRYKDAPISDGQPPMPAEEAERVMHVALPIGDHTVLMGSDISTARGQKLNVGNNVYVSLHPTSLDEAERLFKGLAAGGMVEMALQKMFWGDHFAALKDRFGVQWMISFHQED